MSNYGQTNSNESQSPHSQWKVLREWLIDSELEIFMTICIVTFIVMIFVLSNPRNLIFN